MNNVKMKYNPDIHHRRSIRLKGYDYSQSGLYFITICAQARLCLFGIIENGTMFLNDAGKMIQTVWNEIPIYYNGFDINEFVVMPNHIHGIMEIKHNSNPANIAVGATPRGCPIRGCPESIGKPTLSIGQPIGQPRIGQARGPAPTGKKMSLSDIVHRFKTLTTKQYTDGVKQHNWQRFNKKLWQRNYYEHIIRSEKSYLQISEYIQTNPLKWQEDKYHESNNIRSHL